MRLLPLPHFGRPGCLLGVFRLSLLAALAYALLFAATRAWGADTSADNPNPALPGADVTLAILVAERLLYYGAALLRAKVLPTSFLGRLVAFILDGLKSRIALVPLLLLPGLAAAQSKPIPFGGCNAAGSVCAGPTTSVALLGIDLKTGDLTTGIMPGVGYQLTIMADKWHKVGLGGYVNVQTASGGAPPTGLLSGILSFAEYVRAGVGWQAVGGTHRWLGLLGLGLNFG